MARTNYFNEELEHHSTQNFLRFTGAYARVTPRDEIALGKSWTEGFLTPYEHLIFRPSSNLALELIRSRAHSLNSSIPESFVKSIDKNIKTNNDIIENYTPRCNDSRLLGRLSRNLDQIESLYQNYDSIILPDLKGNELRVADILRQRLENYYDDLSKILKFRDLKKFKEFENLRGIHPNDLRYIFRGNQYQQSENSFLISEINQKLAKERLHNSNLRLVVNICKKEYFTLGIPYRKRRVPFSDVLQEGAVGLMRAVNKFDYQRGNRFSTMAQWWIRQGVRRYLQDNMRMIRIPVFNQSRIYKIKSTIRDFQNYHERMPTDEELVEITGFNLNHIEEAKETNLHSSSLSIDQPIGAQSDNFDPNRPNTIEDFIEQNLHPDPETMLEKKELAYLIKRELYWLDTEQEIEAHNGQRLEEVIKKRFGFIGSEEGRSLEDIGNDYGLTRERIRQLELKSIKRLRWKKDLRDYVGI
ncbi:sigma-70 family RNA polymerase sigma factor [archaeon]|jgi:RNA polymerase sigma factor (sigma-70 family)|nr:sigma-70 family RNA polymerase sigma factor [archaeon]MBT3450547.1 sigma-70 family RNA polymerase sigma factor [archaeon]MBT6868519.1 sigma-70 family RNA polymerase sigma factor [archaeon]MBT7193053.1 sigma-70 family RNA polymerase sigma factor [archaeon]MBT7381142.1 sigma-70 family RNA polymerase sigma factor [archaeon]